MHAQREEQRRKSGGSKELWQVGKEIQKKQLSKATGSYTTELVREKGSGGSLGKIDKTAQVNKKATGVSTGDFHPESVVSSQ